MSHAVSYRLKAVGMNSGIKSNERSKMDRHDWIAAINAGYRSLSFRSRTMYPYDVPFLSAWKSLRGGLAAENQR